MSTDWIFCGVKKIDMVEFNKMYKIAKKCYEDGDEFPKAVVDYFENDNYTIDDYEFEDDNDSKNKCSNMAAFIDIDDDALEGTDDEYGGYLIDVSKLPKDIEKIHVYMC